MKVECGAAALQKNHFLNRFQRDEMSVLSDVALPTMDVPGSTMAYREAGDRGAPVAFFPHGNPTSSSGEAGVVRSSGGLGMEQLSALRDWTTGAAWRLNRNGLREGEKGTRGGSVRRWNCPMGPKFSVWFLFD
jgi:hypothetical protein